MHNVYHNYFNLDKFLNYDMETSFKYCFTKKFNHQVSLLNFIKHLIYNLEYSHLWHIIMVVTVLEFLK